jgi:indole-3-glycerol phosphate synthase
VSDLAIHEVPGVVGRIVSRARYDLRERQRRVPRAQLESRVSTDTRDFAGALAGDRLSLIAEFKPRSPSRGDLRPATDADKIATIFDRYAAAISVLCDGPFFGGGLDLLTRVRARTTHPVLCKDFLFSDYQLLEARAAGADAVLLLVSLLPPASLERLLELCHELGMAALVETHDADELATAVRVGASVIGVNSRDLRTLAIDTSRGQQLLECIPADRVRVAESGVQTREDVERLRGCADAVLIGSALMTAPDPAAAIEQLGWTPCR